MINVEVSPQKWAMIEGRLKDKDCIRPFVRVPTVEAKKLRTRGRIKVNGKKFTIVSIRRIIGGHGILFDV